MHKKAQFKNTLECFIARQHLSIRDSFSDSIVIIAREKPVLAAIFIQTNKILKISPNIKLKIYVRLDDIVDNFAFFLVENRVQRGEDKILFGFIAETIDNIGIAHHGLSDFFRYFFGYIQLSKIFVSKVEDNKRGEYTDKILGHCLHYRQKLKISRAGAQNVFNRQTKQPEQYGNDNQHNRDVLHGLSILAQPIIFHLNEHQLS